MQKIRDKEIEKELKKKDRADKDKQRKAAEKEREMHQQQRDKVERQTRNDPCSNTIKIWDGEMDKPLPKQVGDKRPRVMQPEDDEFNESKQKTQKT